MMTVCDRLSINHLRILLGRGDKVYINYTCIAQKERSHDHAHMEKNLLQNRLSLYSIEHQKLKLSKVSVNDDTGWVLRQGEVLVPIVKSELNDTVGALHEHFI